MNGGWLRFTEASGQPFTNQGQCITYAIHHPVSLADLASPSVSGTISHPGGGCSFVALIFSATYPGSSAVGTVTLHTQGCVPPGGANFPLTFIYSGTFTITTNVGTLIGTVAGQINNVFTAPFTINPVSATLTLTAATGTGLFTGTTGTLNVMLQWPEVGTSAFVGTVTPA